MSPPLVSAVIPAYNYGRYVVEAVESVLAQTYAPLEIVVVDDGSSDDTRARLEPHWQAIRYVYQENRGLAAARNTGIRHSRGEWIALLDADDVWHRQKIDCQLRAAAGVGEVALIGSPGSSVLPERLPPDAKVEVLGVRDFLTWTPLAPSSVLIRRACLDAVGLFDETLDAVEDRDMWLRIAARYKVALVSSSCWFYRVHPEQMSQDPELMYTNFARVLRKFFDAHPEHRSLESHGRAFLHLDASVAYLGVGDHRRSIEHLLRSFQRHPAPFYVRGRQAFFRLRLLVWLLVARHLLRPRPPLPRP
jgi:glycosyltransferase involved in cell wall biosynthesis